MNCDFCVIGQPTCTFVISMGFLPPLQQGPLGIEQLDDGRWIACGSCSALVELGDKAALIRRVLSVLKAEGLTAHFSALELAVVNSTLDKQYTALFEAEPSKEPI